jgi:molybdopterin biosynthesis enzyme
VKDSIPETIAKLGDLYVHGVAVKPGKPNIFGQIEKIPVFGLPGIRSQRISCPAAGQTFARLHVGRRTG